MEDPDPILKKEIFRDFPCIQNPCSISFRRRETLQKLLKTSVKEAFLSDFYLFGISPFLIDIKNITGEGLEGVPFPKEKKTKIPHHRIETLASQRLSLGGYLDDWKTKMGKLDRAEGLRGLAGMKHFTDEMAVAVNENPLRIAYQFDGNKLLPIRLHKKFL
jgi:hypothetical protein